MKLTKQASDGDIYALIEEPHLLLPYIRELVRVIPDVRFFVRRLSWIALNMPVSINGRHRQEASSLLSVTTDDGQVLPNYWLTPNAVQYLLQRFDWATIEIAVFWGSAPRYCGTITYFECAFFHSPSPQSPFDLAKLMDVFEMEGLEARDFEAVPLVQFQSAGGDDVSQIAESALAQVAELPIYTTLETLQSECELHVSEGTSSDLFSKLSVWRGGGAGYVSADVYDDYGEVQTLSVLEESDKYHPTVESLEAMSFGTILCLDEQGQILSGAEKHVGDPLWTMFSRG